MRIGFAEGATSVEALNGWVEPPMPARVREAFSSGGRDEQLGAIFRQMRAVVGLNEAALARKLGTDVSVIMDLEAGIADGLPPWRELAAIVERFAIVAGVDPSPILTRLMQVSSAASAKGPSVTSRPPFTAVPPPRTAALPVPLPVISPMPVPAPPRGVTASTARPAPASPLPAGVSPRLRTAEQSGTRAAAVVPSHKHNKAVPPQKPIDAEAVAVKSVPPRRRRLGRVGGPVILLCLLIGGYFAIQHVPRVAYESVGYFPRRLHEPVRNIIDLAVLHTAAVKDGLRWIDVGDPRLRKGDRLKSR